MQKQPASRQHIKQLVCQHRQDILIADILNCKYLIM